MSEDSQKRWDKYFLGICEAVAAKSPCFSIKRGAILVRDNSIVATGYNGPARGIPHCGIDRYKADHRLREQLGSEKWPLEFDSHSIATTCPRRLLGYKSGEGLEWCPAAHAEQNTLANADRLGVSTLDTTLYMNCETPCHICMSLLINAGVVEIVVSNTKLYDPLTQFILENSNMVVRRFNL